MDFLVNFCIGSLVLIIALVAIGGIAGISEAIYHMWSGREEDDKGPLRDRTLTFLIVAAILALAMYGIAIVGKLVLLFL